MNTRETTNSQFSPPLDSANSRDSPDRSVWTPGGRTRFAIACRSASALPIVTPGARLADSVAERTRLKWLSSRGATCSWTRVTLASWTSPRVPFT